MATSLLRRRPAAAEAEWLATLEENNGKVEANLSWRRIKMVYNGFQKGGCVDAATQFGCCR